MIQNLGRWVEDGNEQVVFCADTRLGPPLLGSDLIQKLGSGLFLECQLTLN